MTLVVRDVVRLDVGDNRNRPYLAALSTRQKSRQFNVTTSLTCMDSFHHKIAALVGSDRVFPFTVSHLILYLSGFLKLSACERYRCGVVKAFSMLHPLLSLVHTVSGLRPIARAHSDVDRVTP